MAEEAIGAAREAVSAAVVLAAAAVVSVVVAPREGGSKEMTVFIRSQTEESMSNTLKTVLVILGVTLVLLFMVAGKLIGGYNQVIAMDENVKSKWAQVENQLKRRYDLIPNLVETVKGYAKHEKEIFENIAQARTQYFQAKDVKSQVKSANIAGRRPFETAAASGTISGPQGQSILSQTSGQPGRNRKQNRRGAKTLQRFGPNLKFLYPDIFRKALCNAGRCFTGRLL